MYRVNLENTELFTNKFLDLTPLTVLTGINGSGKTTILKAIENQFDNVKHYKWTGRSIFTKHLEGEKGEILLFEQPEAGLHPKLQLKLADILLTYAQTGRRVVVETHSEYMINRLTRRFIESKEVRDIMKIYFLDQACGLKKTPSEIVAILIDDTRGIVDAPEEFFPKFEDENRKILIAGF